MHWLLRKCIRCGSYTLQGSCTKCGEATVIAHPPRFSPTDKYVRHRLISRTVNES